MSLDSATVAAAALARAHARTVLLSVSPKQFTRERGSFLFRQELRLVLPALPCVAQFAQQALLFQAIGPACPQCGNPGDLTFR